MNVDLFFDNLDSTSGVPLVVEDVAEHDAWFRRQVQAGLDSANAGRLVSAEDVEAEFSARRAETRLKPKGNDHEQNR